MAEYIGIDLHKQTSYVTKMDAQGKILEQRNLRNDPDTLRGYLTSQPPDTRFAVEATGNWMYLYELIEDRCPDLVLAHPLKTKAIASARIKTLTGFHRKTLSVSWLAGLPAELRR